MSTSFLVSTFAPFPTLSFSLPSDTPIRDVSPLVYERLNLDQHTGDLLLALPSGPLELFSSAPLSTLHGKLREESENPLVTLRLTPRVVGGKGGFGSQLRAAGGRMSSQKTTNNDSCRDLNGRRLSTVKEGNKMRQYLEEEPLRKKAAADAAKAKLEALERQLGVAPSSEGASSSSIPPVAGKKHRFDDTEFLEQSQDIVDNVKTAVAAGLLKKRKKAKLAASKDDEPAAAPPVAEPTPAVTESPISDAAQVQTETLPVTAAAA